MRLNNLDEWVQMSSGIAMTDSSRGRMVLAFADHPVGEPLSRK